MSDLPASRVDRGVGFALAEPTPMIACVLDILDVDERMPVYRRLGRAVDACEPAGRRRG